MNKERTRDLAVMALLAVLCIVVYGRCLGFEYTLYDDPKIIFENPRVMAGLTWDSIRWAVLNPNFGLYMPLPTLSFMLDRELFGDWAGGYHGMTLAWHVLCVCLFYWVMRRLTGNFAAVAAASVLVAVHPVQAMTVNWISARNEIMPAVFLLLSIDMYRRYCGTRNSECGMRNAGEEMRNAGEEIRNSGEEIRNSEGGTRKAGEGKGKRKKYSAGERNASVNRTSGAADPENGPALTRIPNSAFRIPHFLYYLLSVFFMFLGIMSKQGIVALPLVLLLLDYWPLGRLDLSFRAPGQTLRRALALAVEKLPWFALSAAGAVLAVYGKRDFDAFEGETLLSPLDNIGFALTAFARYLGHLVYPERYIMAFSASGPGPSWWMIGGSACLLLGITVFAVSRIWRRPWIPVFWGWFVLFLLPVSGLVRYAAESIALRYLYTPGMGLYLLLGFGLSAAAVRFGKGTTPASRAVPHGFWAIVVLLALVSGGLAFRQSGFWRTAESLAQRALEVTHGNNAMAHNHLGVISDRRGMDAQAFAHLREAVELEPNRNVWKANYAAALNQRQRYEETLALIGPALEEQPDSVVLLNLYGGALTGLRRFDEAIPRLQHALEFEPRYVPALYNLSLCLMHSGREAEARPYLERVLEIQPSHQAARKALETIEN